MSLSMAPTAPPVPPQAVELVKGFEGFRAVAYRDPGTDARPYTAGYGSTRDLQGRPFALGQRVSVPEATALLERDLKDAAATVSQRVHVALTEPQRAALVSLCYNIGDTAFGTSTLLWRLNKGDYAGAAQQFLVWNRSGGQVLPGLSVRRATERRVFLSDTAPAHSKEA